MLRLPFWPRRHSYRLTAWRRWAGHEVPLFRCAGCGIELHLDRWQVRALPWATASCRKGVPLTVQEVLRLLRGGPVDCFDNPASCDYDRR